MASGASSLSLDDIDDDVHCPVCWDMYKQPQALKCLHTLCLNCVKKVKKNTMIPCPLCKKETEASEVLFDFKTKRLVELYMRIKNAAAVDENRSTSAPKYPTQCGRCKKSNYDVFCTSCETYFCFKCRQEHIRRSKCKYHHCQKARDIAAKLRLSCHQYLKNLEEIRKKLLSSQEKVIAETNTSRDVWLEGSKQRESRDRAELMGKYETQRQLSLELSKQRIDSVTAECEELVSLTNNIEEKIKDITSTVSEHTVHDALQKQQEIKDDLQRFDHDKWPKWLPLNLCPRMERGETSVVQTSDIGEINLHGGFAEKDRCQVNREFYFQFQSFFILEGKLIGLVLKPIGQIDHAMVIEFNTRGQVERTICNPGRLGRSYCAVPGIRDIYVASNDLGLLAVSMNGTINKLARGWCECVCTGLDGSIYAVMVEKKDDIFSWMEWMYAGFVNPVHIVKIDNGEISKRINTPIKCRTRVFHISLALYTCSVVEECDSIFICSANCRSIYKVSLTDGRVLCTFGFRGSNFPGELARPYIGCQVYYDLVIADKDNNRLQVFNTVTDTWSVVNVSVPRPISVAIKENEIFVVTALGTLHVFRQTYDNSFVHM